MGRLLGLAVFIICACVSAQAEVNPISGEFVLQHIDLQTKEYIYPFKIQRNYSHRIKSVGMFGNSWCSSLDEQLVDSGIGLEIKKCGQSTKAVFSRKENVYANPAGNDVVQVMPGGKGYVRVTSDFVYGYNGEGRIFSVAFKKNPKKPFLKYYYSRKGFLEKVIHNNKNHYVFTFDVVNKLLKRVRGPNIDVTYTYDATQNLISVVNGWKKKIQYGYDQKNRMASVMLPQASQAITYDERNDFAIKIVDEKQCATTFAYQTDAASAKLTAVVKNSCSSQQKNYSSNNSPMFFKNRSDKEKLFRAPASISPQLIDLQNGWKNFTTDNIRWAYFENENGLILQIKATELKTGKTQIINTKYQDQKLVEINLDGQDTIYFQYAKNKMTGMTPQNQTSPTKYKAFRQFTEFLLAKAWR